MRSLTLSIILFIAAASVNVCGGEETCDCTNDPIGVKNCTGGAQQGTKALSDFLLKKYPGGKTEVYNCRLIPGSSTLSYHAVGRAVDYYPGSQDVFDYLVSVACKAGIQVIIYDSKIWTKSAEIQEFTGQDGHKDNVHIVLNNCGAKQEKFLG